jgi:hypothetical protein
MPISIGQLFPVLTPTPLTPQGEGRNPFVPACVPFPMAAPVRRPQFLLPWIAACTLILGGGLHLLAPELPRRGPAANRGAQDDPAIEPVQAPLPARLEPNGDSLLVQEDAARLEGGPHELPADPSRPAGLAPGGVRGADAANATAAQLAARAANGEASEAERALDRAPAAPIANQPRQPALRQSDAGTQAASDASALPSLGEAVRLRWSGSVPGASAEAQPAGPPRGPELVILRVSDDAYQAFLLLEDDAVEESGTGDDARPEAPRTGGTPDPVVTAPDAEPAATPALKQRWAHWFAVQIPHRPGTRPESRTELREKLERVLGPGKARHLVAVTRTLDPREAIALLARAQQWARDQRAG